MAPIISNVTMIAPQTPFLRSCFISQNRKAMSGIAKINIKNQLVPVMWQRSEENQRHANRFATQPFKKQQNISNTYCDYQLLFIIFGALNTAQRCSIKRMNTKNTIALSAVPCFQHRTIRFFCELSTTEKPVLRFRRPILPRA